MNLPDPSLTPAYVLAAVAATVSLFLTQGLITNGVGKLVTGLASIFVPLVLVGIHALVKARIHAAKVQAAASVPPVVAPPVVPPAA